MMLFLGLLLTLGGTADEHLPLRILYASNPGTPYTAKYEQFLKAHCDSVRTVAASALGPHDLKDADVLLVDGEVETRGADGKFASLHREDVALTLEELQGFPVVMMGGQGGFLSDDLHLKLSWHHG